MNKTGWLKEFVDGTKEEGWDDNPAASWSKGRLSGLIELTVFSKQGKMSTLCGNLDGTTEFWYSEDYEAVPGFSSKLICRRMQCKNDEGKWFIVEVDPITGDDIRDYISDHKI